MPIRSDFTPEALYTVEDLNNLLGCFITCGLIGNNDIKVKRLDNERVQITEGVAVLPTKKILTINKGGMTYDASLDKDQYIYITSDGEIVIGDHPANADDFLILAHIWAGGIYEYRTMATLTAERG